MNRRVWCGSLATTAAWVGVVTAQAPPAAAPAAATPAATDGPVYVMKTAGQPERRVKVVKSEKLPDGTFLTDVKDLATGVVYTLTNPAVLGTPATTAATAAAPAPKPTAVASNPLPPANTYVPPAATTLPPGTPRPIFGSFPNQPQPVASATPTMTGLPTSNAAPRPVFGGLRSQQAQTPDLRTAAGEKLVPAESLLPFGNPPQPAANPHGLPQARSRKTDPLLAGMASTPAAMTARTPFTPGPNDPPSLLGKYLGTEQPKDLPQPRVGTYPPAPTTANLGAPPTMLPPPSALAVAPNPMLAPKPAAAAVSVPVTPVAKATPAPKPAPAPAPAAATAAPAPAAVGDLAIPSIAPDAKPSAATGIFDSQPPAPTPAAEPPRPTAPVLIPPIEATAGPARILPPITETPPAATPPEPTPPKAAPMPVPPAVETPAPVATPAPAVEVPAPAVTPAPIEIPLPKAVPLPAALPVPAAVPVPAVEPAPKLPAAPTGFPVPAIKPAAAAVPAAAAPQELPIPSVLDAAPATTAPATLPADVLTMIDGLKHHRRPSFRMENATSLAESPFASHPDVIAALVEAAKNDAAGVVRGHCINQLATLGYSDAAYLKALATWEGDAEPAVRRAAAAARAKLVK